MIFTGFELGMFFLAICSPLVAIIVIGILGYIWERLNELLRK